MNTVRVWLAVSVAVLLAVSGAWTAAWPQGPGQLPSGGPDPDRVKARKMEWSLYEAAQNTGNARQMYFGGVTDTALVLIDLTGPLTAAQRQLLERRSVRVIKVWGSTVYARSPLERLFEVRDLPFVRFLRRPRRPHLDQEVFQPWASANLPAITPSAGGHLVTIGIIDQFDFNRLPGQIAGKSTTCRYTVVEHSDPALHGNVVTEIVARMAKDIPGIRLCLYPAGAADELRGIVAHAAAHGVDVLTSSLSYFDEFDFFDGHSPLARDISRGLGTRIVFVASAGNYADRHYLGTYAHAPNHSWHQFAAGQETFGIKVNGTVEVLLNWDSWNAQAGIAYALDLYLYTDDLNAVVAKSLAASADPEAEPFHIIEQPNLHGAFKVAVGNASPIVQPVAFHLFVFEPAQVDPRDRGIAVAQRSIVGVVQPIDNVIAVGAVRYPAGTIWEYSSQGPTGDGRMKPDLVGYSPVSSDLHRQMNGNSEAHGTSYTAPQVAVAAALLRLKNPALSAEGVKRALMQSASLPFITAILGNNRNVYGAGILNVRRAFETALIFPLMRDGMPLDHEGFRATQTWAGSSHTWSLRPIPASAQR